LCKLEELKLEVVALNDTLTHALAHHPSLRRLHLVPDRVFPSTALATLLSQSPSITSLKFQPAGFINLALRLQDVQRNVHLFNTNLFEWCSDVDRSERAQLMYRLSARNHRLLHNWCCICVFLASYRANAHSPIRDSIVSIWKEEMRRFFVSDEWYVERWHG
jgi:hypothetical protein